MTSIKNRLFDKWYRNENITLEKSIAEYLFHSLYVNTLSKEKIKVLNTKNQNYDTE